MKCSSTVVKTTLETKNSPTLVSGGVVVYLVNLLSTPRCLDEAYH